MLKPFRDAMCACIIGGGGKAKVAELLVQTVEEFGGGRDRFMRVEWIA